MYFERSNSYKFISLDCTEGNLLIQSHTNLKLRNLMLHKGIIFVSQQVENLSCKPSFGCRGIEDVIGFLPSSLMPTLTDICKVWSDIDWYNIKCQISN